MNLKIEMNLDNEAFQHAPRAVVENCIGEALGKVPWRNMKASEIDGVVTDPIKIYDPNGNSVGHLLISP